jgi:hypothetical protein
MSVNSIDNLDLLNQILSNNIIKSSQPEIFKNILQFEIDKVHANRIRFKSNLTQMNKAVISNIQSITNEYIAKKTNKNSEPNKRLVKINEIKLNDGEIRLNPRPTEISSLEKENIFENRVKEQENNFKLLNHPPKPKDIDFSDNFDEEPLKLESYDETMRKREEELKLIINENTKNTQDAEKWLKLDKENKNVTFDLSEKLPRETTNKVVNNKTINFLNKLKSIDKTKPIEDIKPNEIISQTNIYNMLNKILNNQDIILNKLNTLNSTPDTSVDTENTSLSSTSIT